MTTELPGGVITEENFDDFANVTKGALAHMIDEGEIAEFSGEPLSREEALDHLGEFLDLHKTTLTEAGTEFLSSLVRRIGIGDEPEETGDEFEAGLASLTVEQLTVLSEGEAGEIAELKAAIVDRRRELVADATDVGKTLLRGALATGLHSLIGAS